jgi:hypothetical protein
MRPERFIIINNRADKIALIRSLLTKLDYDPERIWPPSDTTVYTKWPTVFELLVRLKPKGFDPSGTECFLMLDLALDANDQLYEDGIGQISTNADNLEPYICILFTLWSPAARRKLYGTVADGVIDAGSFGNTGVGQTDSGRSARVLDFYLQSAVEAWTKRTNRKPSAPREDVLIIDSPGARAVSAALPQYGINYLVRTEARNWSHVTVRALTGGFSGAHLLRIDGEEDSAPRSVVCKISRARTPLDQEMKRMQEAMKSYAASLGPLPAYINSTPKEIGDGVAWYIVQAMVPGESVESLIAGSATVNEDEMKIVLAYAQRFAETQQPGWKSERSMLRMLKMDEQDVERFETSRKRLSELAELAREHGCLSDPRMRKSDIDRFGSFIADWNAQVKQRFDTAPHIEQHGDFNARNILVWKNEVRLIDFARYGPWPVGYDLTRFELQLLLRGADAFAGRDEFPHYLPDWTTLWEATRPANPASRPADTQVNPRHERLLAMIDEVARIRHELMIRLLPDSEWSEEKRRRLMAVLRTFDAVRICSYQDASTFKQLWFLQIAMHSALDAGFDFL